MAKLTTIEGIGANGAAKLAKAKVGSTTTLLTRGATAAGRGSSPRHPASPRSACWSGSTGPI